MYLLVLIVGMGLVVRIIHLLSKKGSLQPVQIRFKNLIFVAAVPQLIMFYIPFTRSRMPSEIAPVVLVLSQTILLIVIMANWRQNGFSLLALGLILNLVVIILNGGFMPISHETVTQLGGTVEIGSQIDKDVVLSSSNIVLSWLSDRFVVPGWLPYKAAFSLGDVFITIGALLFAWTLGNTEGVKTKEAFGLS